MEWVGWGPLLRLGWGWGLPGPPGCRPGGPALSQSFAPHLEKQTVLGCDFSKHKTHDRGVSGQSTSLTVVQEKCKHHKMVHENNEQCKQAARNKV